MFKVSLLPASYRKYLEGKKKKDLILKVALLILACMLVIYAGLYARTLILNGHLKDINKQNSVVVAEIDDLQQYKTIYDELMISQNRLESIKAKEPSALKFMTLVQENRPEYIEIKAISMSNWQNGAVCVIEGELSAAQKIRDAVEHLRAYEEFLKTNENFSEYVTEVRVANELPAVSSGENGDTYSFRVYVSLGGEIVMDEDGNLVTTTTTTTTTTTETTTASAETSSTEATTVAE